jgi:hypothetical protein
MTLARSRDATEASTEKGISLARGPALMIGTILLAAGLYFLYKAHYFPKFSNFPNGKAPVDDKVFGIFGANGWTGMLTAVAGGLLLFGAAQHLLAKTMSLIVGVALGAAAIIAAVSGDVLGLAAANGWTELAWGVVAAILLLNTMVPRRRRGVEVAETRPDVAADRVAGQPGGALSRGPSTMSGAGNRTVVATDPVLADDGEHAERESGYAGREGEHVARESGYAEREGERPDREGEHANPPRGS